MLGGRLCRGELVRVRRVERVGRVKRSEKLRW